MYLHRLHVHIIINKILRQVHESLLETLKKLILLAFRTTQKGLSLYEGYFGGIIVYKTYNSYHSENNETNLTN